MPTQEDLQAHLKLGHYRAAPRSLLSVSKPEGILALTGRRLVEYASIP